MKGPRQHSRSESVEAELGELLGAGAMGVRAGRYLSLGEVRVQGRCGTELLAIDRLTNRRVAVRTQHVPSEEVSREFLAFSLIGAFPHQNVSTMLDYYVGSSSEGLLHTVHEVCSTSLWEVYETGPPRGLPKEQVRRHVCGLTSGVGHLHRHHVIHTNLNLKDIFLDVHGEVKVSVGHGFAAHTCFVPQEGEEIDVCPLYVQAPELTLGSQESMPTIDVWAIGVLAFCLRSLACPWLSERSGIDVMRVQLSLLGPIDSTSWPDHSLLPNWDLFESKYRFENGMNDSRTFSERASAMVTLGEPLDDLEEEFFCATLRWHPEGRHSCDMLLELPMLRGRAPPDGRAANDALDARAASDASAALPDSRAASEASAAVPDARAASEAMSHARAAKHARAARHADAASHPDASDPDAASGPVRAGATGPGFCECSSNCGSNLCKRRKMGSMVSTCPLAPLLGQRFCFRCKCEVRDCHRPRNGQKGSRRWCCGHQKSLADRLPGSVNPYNSQNPCKPPESSINSRSRHWQLKLVHRLAHILPALLPEDICAALEIGQPCQPGENVPGTWLCALWFAQMMRWPPAVRFFYRTVTDKLLTEEESPTVTNDIAAKILVDACLQTIQDANDQDFRGMLSNMSSPGAGLAVVGECLGLIVEMSGDRRKRRRGKSGEAGSSCRLSGMLSSPRREKRFEFPARDPDQQAQQVAMVQEMLDSASSGGFRWPQTSQELGPFMIKMVSWAQTVRQLEYGTFGFGCTDEKDSVYAFCRIVLMLVDGPHGRMSDYDTLKFEDVQGWLPGHPLCSGPGAAEPFQGLVQDAQRQLGVSAMQVSLWLHIVDRLFDAGLATEVREAATDTKLIDFLEWQVSAYVNDGGGMGPNSVCARGLSSLREFVVVGLRPEWE